MFDQWFDEGENAEEYLTGYKVQDTPWSFSGITYEQETQQHDAYVYKMLPERLEYDMLDGFESAEMALVNPFGVSSMDVLYSEFTAFYAQGSPKRMAIYTENFLQEYGIPIGL